MVATAQIGVVSHHEHTGFPVFIRQSPDFSSRIAYVHPARRYRGLGRHHSPVAQYDPLPYNRVVSQDGSHPYAGISPDLGAMNYGSVTKDYI